MSSQVALRLVKSGSSQALQAATELEISVREFLIALRQEGCVIGTIEKYRQYLAQFCGWMSARGVLRPQQITRLLVREWGAELHDNGWSPATIRLVTSIARSFLAWCWDERLIDEQLGSVLSLPRVKDRKQRTLRGDEVQAILSVCDDSVIGLRNAALVSLLIDSGLRSVEARNLKVGDLKFDVPFGRNGDKVNFATVISKGGDEDVVGFGQGTAQRLKAWLAVRMARPGVEEVFVSLGGRTPLCKLTRHGLRNTTEKLGLRAGVEGATPHAFRRGFACLLDEAGASSRRTQLLGRWSSIEMVERYTRDLNVARSYRDYSPIDYLEHR